MTSDAFWRYWEDLNEKEQAEEVLPLLDVIQSYKVLEIQNEKRKELMRNAAARLLNSYFRDLKEYLQEGKRNEIRLSQL